MVCQLPSPFRTKQDIEVYTDFIYQFTSDLDAFAFSNAYSCADRSRRPLSFAVPPAYNSRSFLLRPSGWPDCCPTEPHLYSRTPPLEPSMIRHPSRNFLADRARPMSIFLHDARLPHLLHPLWRKGFEGTCSGSIACHRTLRNRYF